jgi:hypothetical protein
MGTICSQQSCIVLVSIKLALESPVLPNENVADAGSGGGGGGD